MRRSCGILLSLVMSVGVLGLLGPSAQAAPARAASTTTGCLTTLTASEKARLIEASDTSDLSQISDAVTRLKDINSVFAARKDPRGTFPVFYEAILTHTDQVMATEHFNDPVWSRRIAIAFVSGYFDNLHGYLTGGRVTDGWKKYYRLAENCRNSAGLVASQGLATHMIFDFPEALVSAGTQPSNREDYLHFGDALIDVTPTIIANIEKIYGVNLAPLFQLYVVGTVLGTSTVTTAFFSSVRELAWTNYLKMRRSPFLAKLAMTSEWAAASTYLQAMAWAGKL